MPPWQGWIYALGSCGGDALTFWREVLTVVSMTHFLQNQVTGDPQEMSEKNQTDDHHRNYATWPSRNRGRN